MKIVYIAGSLPAEAAADLRRLGLLWNGTFLRVVVPAGSAPQLAKLVSLPPDRLWVYEPISAPLLWLRLLRFLGFSKPAEIICFSPPKRFRTLKLLALLLRGRVSFSDGNGTCVSFSLGRLLWVGLRRMVAARGPICMIGSASPGLLRTIIASVRDRYPGAPLHAVLPSASLRAGPASPERSATELLDSWDVSTGSVVAAYAQLLPRCIGRNRFRTVILPWTNENRADWKWLGWFLPLWSVEIYNENMDSFAGRSAGRLLRHVLWRTRAGIRRRWEQHRRDRERYLSSLPVGVIGSASAFYLKKILPVVRARYPGARLHALLPESLEGPAGGLFDSVAVLRRRSLSAWAEAWKIVRTRHSFQCWIVPCTNEPYHGMKLLAFLLPLVRCHIYNEMADGFAVRGWRTLYRHLLWRLRDHLSFQIVAGAAGKNLFVRSLHLVLYGARLLAGLPWLWKARLQSRRGTGVRRGPLLPKSRVDLLILGSRQGNRDLSERFSNNGRDRAVRVVWIPEGAGQVQQVNVAIQNSAADFVCLLDRECTISPSNWLDRLLESFDDRTAQVGPEIAGPDGERFVRGLLLGGSGALQWNCDHAVRWHIRPEWLEVDALPWICLLLRRSVFSQVGYFSERSGGGGIWADVDFCRRLAARGWRSVCNRSVAATHPAVRAAQRVESGRSAEEVRQ